MYVNINAYQDMSVTSFFERVGPQGMITSTGERQSIDFPYLKHVHMQEDLKERRERMSCFNNENGVTEQATVLGCSGEIDLVQLRWEP